MTVSFHHRPEVLGMTHSGKISAVNFFFYLITRTAPKSNLAEHNL